MIDLSLHEIKNMSKDTFKTLIHTAVKSRAFSWLVAKLSQLEKIKNISDSKLEMQNYLEQPILSINQTKFWFSARGKMLFVRTNYPNMENKKFCPLCATELEKVLDTQEHLLSCVMSNSAEVIENYTSYNDLFSANLLKQRQISLILESRYTLRKKILSHNQGNKVLPPGEP